MISAGGAIGGIFVSLIAPQIFDTHFEWTLGARRLDRGRRDRRHLAGQELLSRLAIGPANFEMGDVRRRRRWRSLPAAIG